MNTLWIIRDWAWHKEFGGQYFSSFESAEAFLAGFLGDSYEWYRADYEIVKKD